MRDDSFFIIGVHRNTAMIGNEQRGRADQESAVISSNVLSNVSSKPPFQIQNHSTTNLHHYSTCSSSSFEIETDQCIFLEENATHRPATIRVSLFSSNSNRTQQYRGRYKTRK